MAGTRLTELLNKTQEERPWDSGGPLCLTPSPHHKCSQLLQIQGGFTALVCHTSLFQQDVLLNDAFSRCPSQLNSTGSPKGALEIQPCCRAEKSPPKLMTCL